MKTCFSLPAHQPWCFELSLKKSFWLIPMVFLFFQFSGYSQNLGDIPNVDDYTGKTWKSVADMDTTLSAEHVRMQQLLTNVNLSDGDKANANAYALLLEGVQLNLPENTLPFQEFIIKLYQAIVDQAPNSASLKHIHVGTFRQQFDWLMEQLQELPKPQTSNN